MYQIVRHVECVETREISNWLQLVNLGGMEEIIEMQNFKKIVQFLESSDLLSHLVVGNPQLLQSLCCSLDFIVAKTQLLDAQYQPRFPVNS